MILVRQKMVIFEHRSAVYVKNTRASERRKLPFIACQNHFMEAS